MPTRLSPDCQDLISKMITVDHTRRIKAVEALHHPWFNLIKDKGLLKSMSMNDQQEMDKEVI
jgi:serine/threonine protein kinase